MYYARPYAVSRQGVAADAPFQNPKARVAWGKGANLPCLATHAAKGAVEADGIDASLPASTTR